MWVSTNKGYVNLQHVVRVAEGPVREHRAKNGACFKEQP
jgi:hypothetical protein